MSSGTHEALREELLGFLGSCRTLILATADEDGTPGASYAPFIRDTHNCFYIFVSELARHTAVLASTARARAWATGARRGTGSAACRAARPARWRRC